MLTEPKKLNRFLMSFYRKLDRLGLEVAMDRKEPRIVKAVDFLRDRFSRGDSNPRSWRALMAMFYAGRRLGVSFDRAWMKSWLQQKNIRSMTDQEKIEFATDMAEWADQPLEPTKPPFPNE